MRVKRFVAVNMQEAVEKIKSELGNDAVILHTRYFKEGGFLGLFRKKYIEVTAAVDHEAHHDLSAVKEEILVNSFPPNREIVSDLAAMRQLMQEMSFMLGNMGEPKFPEMGQALYHRLLKLEVDNNIAQKIVKAAIDEYLQTPLQTQEELNRIFLAHLLEPIQKIKYKPVIDQKEKPRVLTFIGPTGVGKTTTIAKLAAISAVMEKKKVALITIDTYRIAAVEQLKTIGDIMNVPVKVVFDPQNLQECLREMQDYDVIYIDTAGRSHKNETQVKELKEYLRNVYSNDIFLVLASTSKYQDFLDILETYQDVSITSLIFTKLDETSNYGAIYNLIYQGKYPISYFANGQNIPDDIEIAEPLKFVQMLMKE